MTIEERAKEYATRVVGGEYHGGFKGEVWLDRYAIYTEVATEQKAIDTEKACEQFCHCMGCGMYDKCHSEGDFCDAFSNFKKAIDETL